MGDIALTASLIRPCFTDPGHCTMYVVEAGEDLTKGEIVCWNATGAVVLADGNTAALDEPIGVVIKAGESGKPVTILTYGPVYGFTVAGVATGVILTLSDTDFGILESAGAGEHCGRVWALSEGGTAEYVVFFDFDISAASV